MIVHQKLSDQSGGVNTYILGKFYFVCSLSFKRHRLCRRFRLFLDTKRWEQQGFSQALAAQTAALVLAAATVKTAL